MSYTIEKSIAFINLREVRNSRALNLGGCEEPNPKFSSPDPFGMGAYNL